MNKESEVDLDIEKCVMLIMKSVEEKQRNE